MDNSDFRVLNEIYKGSHMGMDSISNMKEAISDNNFKEEVNKQYDEYKKVADRVENILTANNQKLEELPAKDKIMGWTSVKMNTMMDSTTSHMAEILIQGTVMGIIEGVKLSNQNTNLDNETKNTLDEFVKIGEDNIQVLKTYL